MIDKEQLRANKRRIREVLFYVWDPIGVSKISRLDDEYSTYEGRVHYLLRTGASDDEIADYLLWAETECMRRRNATRERLQPAIAALRALEIPIE